MVRSPKRIADNENRGEPQKAAISQKYPSLEEVECYILENIREALGLPPAEEIPEWLQEYRYAAMHGKLREWQKANPELMKEHNIPPTKDVED